MPGVHGVGSEMVNWYLVEEGGRLTAVDAGVPEQLGLRKTVKAVHGIRSLRKSDLAFNG